MLLFNDSHGRNQQTLLAQIRLLQTPTSQPQVVKNTLDGRANYDFTSSEQRKQIRSSILICLDLNAPCALVVSSNEKNAFSESESEVMLFIKYIGELARYDLIDGDFFVKSGDLGQNSSQSPQFDARRPGISPGYCRSID